MQQGIEKARAFEPDFLLLSDADIEHAPRGLARLLAISETSDYDMASCIVKLQCQTFAERLLIPAFVYFFFQLYPPGWIADRRNLLLTGASGLGKSWLACALGHKACRENISVLYTRMPRLFADLAIAHGDARYPRAAFYAYAHPAPADFASLPVSPAAARWEAALGEYVLDWDDVRSAPDPHAAALEFARSAFRHACVACGWDMTLAATAEGTPPPVR